MIQFSFAAFNAVLNGLLAFVAYAHGQPELAMIAAFVSGGTAVAAISYLAIR